MKIPIEIHPNALWRSLQLVIDSANFATHTSETLVHPRTAKEHHTNITKHALK